MVARFSRPDDWDAVRALRTRVFIDEQGVPPELELDDADREAIHVVAIGDGEQVIGTGRLVVSADQARIGRMAVDRNQRGRGVGTAVLALLEEAARQRQVNVVELHAQQHAVGFYEQCGYATEGDLFEEAGIAHVRMRRRLSPTGSSG